jgi:hypothetical protein
MSLCESEKIGELINQIKSNVFITFRIDNKLVHASWTQCSAYTFGNGLTRYDVT